jgi:hypothetical protein
LRSNIPRSALCATLDTYNFLFYFSRFGSSAAVSKMILRVAMVIVFTLYCNCSLLSPALGNFKSSKSTFGPF